MISPEMREVPVLATWSSISSKVWLEQQAGRGGAVFFCPMRTHTSRRRKRFPASGQESATSKDGSAQIVRRTVRINLL